ncbi:MAG: hypothetical protein ABW065_09905 [Solirubrobacterales bacterium]
MEGFAVEVLAALTAEGEGADEVAERAVQVYISDAAVQPPGWRVPVELEAPAEDSVEVRLDEDSVAAIEAEAGAQGVRPATILGHAVMYLWAAERGPVPRATDETAPTPGVSALDATPQGRRRVSPRTSGG